MTEPELAPGDSGDVVVQVQAVLHALGFDTAVPDGRYDERTATAVRSFQQAHGLDPTGIVDAATRQALAQAASGLPPDGAVTEQQQWHWDGEQWQPGAGSDAPSRDRAAQHLSHDGQWLWDGSGWQQVPG